MSRLQICFGVLVIVLLFVPSALALEGESPVKIFDRLTEEGLLVVYALSTFFFVLGAGMIVFGGASPKIRSWGIFVIICVLGGNFALVAGPWVLNIIRGL